VPGYPGCPGNQAFKWVSVFGENHFTWMRVIAPTCCTERCTAFIGPPCRQQHYVMVITVTKQTKCTSMLLNLCNTYIVSHKKGANLFLSATSSKFNRFNAVFSVRFNDEWHMWWYELYPPHLITVATLPCESRKMKNVLQWGITKENCIKCIV